MRKFLLQPNVFVCINESGCIFLDAERDKYLGLSATRARELRFILDGCPAQLASDSPIDAEDAATLANNLVNAGLLTNIESAGKPLMPVIVEPVTNQVEWDSPRPKVHFHHVRAFFMAVTSTAISLHRYSHANLITSLQRRKDHRRGITDPIAAHELAYIFRLIRPFGYTAKNQCLRDSLTLMWFMLHYGISPTLVFGVRISPFLAHCWVQIGPLALNCSTEYARAFLPIRAV